MTSRGKPCGKKRVPNGQSRRKPKERDRGAAKISCGLIYSNQIFRDDRLGDG